MTDARRRVFALLETEMAWSRTGLVAAAGVSPGVVDGLVKAGSLEEVALSASPPPVPPDPAFAIKQLTPEQQKAAEALRAAVVAGYSVNLLDGVTGSGKTEVYFEAIAAAIAKGTQALVMLPEIALTGQFLDRFEERFGARPAEWHSDVSPATAGPGLARCRER